MRSDSGSQIRALLDPGLKRLDADLGRLRHALGALGPKDGSDVPAAAVRAVTDAQTHVVELRAAIAALKTQNPAKKPVLASLALLATALVTSGRALEARDPAQSDRLASDADALFAHAAQNFLTADRALGCPYGCRPLPARPTRRRTP